MTDFELPLLQVDSVVSVSSATALALVNRDPSPGETDIPVDSTIRLELVAPDGGTTATIALSTVSVTVNGVQAVGYSGGTFFITAPFLGSRAGGVTSAWHALIILDPVAGLPSLGAINMVVEASLTDGTTLREEYSFGIEDRTGPVVESALALDQLTVRVSFSEPVALAAAPGFIFTALGAPAVAPGVAGVTFEGNDALVTLDTELSPGIEYRVRATGVADTHGNLVVAPTDNTTFTGFRPQWPPGRVFDLWGMLPKHNRADDSTGDLARFVACFQDVASLLLTSVDRWVEIFDFERAPEAFVDVILQDLGNPFNFDLTLADKRRLCSVLVQIYRQKGTAPGLKNAVRFFLGLEVEVLSFVQEVLTLGESFLGYDWELGLSLIHI